MFQWCYNQPMESTMPRMRVRKAGPPRVQQGEIAGDRVLLGRNGTALVSSKSQPGSCPTVRNNVGDCTWCEYRGHCRHVRAVQAVAPQTVMAPTFEGVVGYCA
jgi:hypothetical protein